MKEISRILRSLGKYILVLFFLVVSFHYLEGSGFSENVRNRTRIATREVDKSVVLGQSVLTRDAIHPPRIDDVLTPRKSRRNGRKRRKPGKKSAQFRDARLEFTPVHSDQMIPQEEHEPPKYMLDLYDRLTAGEMITSRRGRTGNTVRSLFPIRGRSKRTEMLVFNLTGILQQEDVFLGELHFYNWKKGKPKLPGQLRRTTASVVPNLPGSHANPQYRVHFFDINSDDVTKLGSLAVSGKPYRWQVLDITKMIALCRETISRQHLLGLSFQEANGGKQLDKKSKEKKHKFRDIPLDRFIAENTTPFLILYSNDPGNQTFIEAIQARVEAESGKSLTTDEEAVTTAESRKTKRSVLSNRIPQIGPWETEHSDHSAFNNEYPENIPVHPNAIPNAVAPDIWLQGRKKHPKEKQKTDTPTTSTTTEKPTESTTAREQDEENPTFGPFDSEETNSNSKEGGLIPYPRDSRWPYGWLPKYPRKGGRGGKRFGHFPEDSGSGELLPTRPGRRKHRKKEPKRRRHHNRRLPQLWDHRASNRADSHVNHVNSATLPAERLFPSVSSSSHMCRKRKLMVDFSDIGWGERIISPKSFEASFCSGSCPFPMTKDLHPTNHATIQSLVNALGLSPHVPPPCCVADSMSSLTLLYFEDGDVVLKNYPNMIIDSCACR